MIALGAHAGVFCDTLAIIFGSAVIAIGGCGITPCVRAGRTSQPEWLAVSTGLFGTRVSFVPITGATLVDDGDVMVAHGKDMVKDAPNAEADGQLSIDEEAELDRHYGTTADQTAAPVASDPARNDAAEGYDTSGPTTDDLMTRSEEELDVSTTSRVAGQARLRKWVETEVETDEIVVDEEVRNERIEMDHDAITVDVDPDAPASRYYQPFGDVATRRKVATSPTRRSADRHRHQ